MWQLVHSLVLRKLTMKSSIPAWKKGVFAVIAGIGFGTLVAVSIAIVDRNRASDPSLPLAENYNADPATFSRLFHLANPDNKENHVSPEDLSFLVQSLDNPNRGIRKHAFLGLLTRKEALGVGYAQQLVEERFFELKNEADRDTLLLVLFRLSPESESKWTSWANQQPQWRPMVEVHRQWKSARNKASS